MTPKGIGSSIAMARCIGSNGKAGINGSTDWQWIGNRLPKKNGEVNHET